MKRFITISAKDGDEVLIIIRDAAIGLATKDAYDWLKRQIAQKSIGHHDQNAGSHTQLPHKGGYVSFYFEGNRWMKVNH